VLVHGIPAFKEFVDSLNMTDLMVAKWAVNGDSIVQSSPTKVDWAKELETIRKSNVNHLRFRDSYQITDTLIGSERRVSFIANSKDQEVQRMEVRMVKGAIRYLAIDKANSSLFSSSIIEFKFQPNQYSLTLDQQINWVFNNQQHVVGNIYPRGDLWRVNLQFENSRCPINLVVTDNGKLLVKNGNELVRFTQNASIGDSLVFDSDHFNSSFIYAPVSENMISGRWVNRKQDDPYFVSFNAAKNTSFRFAVSTLPDVNLTGSHSASFINEKGEAGSPVELRLKQNKHIVTGSLLTETGDYRFLEGVVRNDSLLLSTMDGTHAYLFEAAISDGSLNGVYKTGTGYEKNWRATLGAKPTMRSAEVITTKNASIPFDFAFPDSKGNIVSLSDTEFDGKPMVVSIMGTWCSNCLDESLFLKEVEELYSDMGLQIIALDFELISDSVKAFANIERHKENLDIKYPVLLASTESTKKRASELLPALSEVSSYPTMLFLDRNHEIVRIHTGFSGPATGQESYDAFRSEYLGLAASLVKQD